jgi:outer membrane protein
MKIHLLAAALGTTLVAAPFAADAAGPAPAAVEPQIVAPSPVPARPKLSFTLRAGAEAASSYFGGKDAKAGPDFGFTLHYLALPGDISFGSTDTNAIRYGFGLRGSFRYIAKRSASDDAELAGLPDVKAAAELGLGLGYTQRNFEAFADIRYGVIGHHAWVGELGANAIFRPTQQLTLRAGPRVFFGDSDYASTYFGVETAAGTFPAHSAKGGALSAGLEIGAVYALNDDWGIDGALRWDKYLNDAKDSPIVQQGRDSNFGIRIGLTRRFSF